MTIEGAVATLRAMVASSAHGETPIPRSAPGDKGRYVLIESLRDGGRVKTLHKRIAPDGVFGFTRAEIDSATRTMREIGSGEGAPDSLRITPTQWFALVPGSSKSALALVVRGRASRSPAR